jgi:hypothetical protein
VYGFLELWMKASFELSKDVSFQLVLEMVEHVSPRFVLAASIDSLHY